jgi:acyl-CoA synthetase (AMP-forming)/AMP-acid ligase II
VDRKAEDVTSPGNPAHLAWTAESVPAGLRARLLGPGAPFELVTEDVLGAPHQVFARRPRSLRQLLDTSAAESPDLVFLVAPGREWTYHQAVEDIDAIAVLLAGRYGVRAGDRVAIVSANSAEHVLVLWAVLSLGAIVTSLNGWWTGHELAAGIQLTGPVLVVGDERRLERLDDGPVPARLLAEILGEAAEFRGRTPSAPDIAEDAAAVILFTSGTTGPAKGATLSHRNVVNYALSQGLTRAIAAAGAPAAGRAASIVVSPMFHVSGFVGVVISGAVFRTKLVFTEPGAWDPGRHLELTERHRITAWSGVPTHFWRLLRHPGLATRDVGSVVAVNSGGAVFPPELVRALRRRLPQARLGNGYGASETVGLGTQASGALFAEHPDSVGVAPPTSEVEIRGTGGTALAEGEIGEIHLRHPSVFLGYWGDREATAAVLDRDRWYATGDFGRIENGLLYLESRRTDLILRGGENVYPIEIENRLVEHAGIAEAAVVGVDHPELGQEVKAFVVRAAGADGLTAEQVREWCAPALAAFKVPSRIEFRPSLPYTVSGKLLKQQLRNEGPQ